ncbi:MAG: alpha/beta hydrolase-fold protein [Prevotella sp.]|nr:alpha/beta hydrolase-fold protein [Prevotella sp.]MCM1074893.1 alpha/beta hydrolase-fold protein [Ruminococcus sp.]
MKINRLICAIAAIGVILGGTLTASSCTGKNQSSEQKKEMTGKDPGGPQLGKPAVGGSVIDKSGDSTLQAMIKEVVPRFKQFEYTDAKTGKTMKYNLFSPKDTDASKKYPLVLFIADASTPGDDVTKPLTQGYGALVWATAESQVKNPCYVLVPQFSGVAVNDAYEKTDEVDIVIRMLNSLVAEKNIDSNRLYATGQSMGGMISMYYNVAYPDEFAASIFVDCHWDNATFDSLVKHRFVYFIAGNEGKAYKCLEPLEEAARREDVQYTFAEWSAKLPEARQSELAAAMLDKGAPVNIFEFEPKTVLPADGKGSEHMYSFDYAYKVTAVRDWLFKQSK